MTKSKVKAEHLAGFPGEVIWDDADPGLPQTSTLQTQLDGSLVVPVIAALAPGVVQRKL